MAAPVILVVEDKPLLRMDAVAMIEDASFMAIGARNTADAIRILQERTDIRVIFTDIDMGDGPDGLWLATCVRERWPPIQIIVTSGHAGHGGHDAGRGLVSRQALQRRAGPDLHSATSGLNLRLPI